MRLANAFCVRAAFWCLLGIGFCVASRSWAGPNAGGTLIVHDTGVEFTSTLLTYPTSAPPCSQVDTEVPVGVPPDGQGWVWKVYAAFDPAATPRLKGIYFGATYSPDVVVLAGGLPSLDFMELKEGGWPITSGAGVFLSFPQTFVASVVELYWFAGYSNTAGGTWSTALHPSHATVFLDDAVPQQSDPIASYGRLGFGQAGLAVCPPADELGACCRTAGGGSCLQLTAADCAAQGGVLMGVGMPCTPNPCSAIAGACCISGYSEYFCTLTLQSDCRTDLGYSWKGPFSTCETDCPYLLEGACCNWGGGCVVTGFQYCPMYYHPGQSCDPNPCPYLGDICCWADGSCTMEGYPGPGCIQAEANSCSPNPCVPTPVQQTSWGRIKSLYR